MRAANRGTIAEATDPNRLVYVSAKEGVPFRRNAIRLNYADASGKVRLFTRSRGARQLTPVENRDVIQWASEQAHPGRAQWVPPGPNQGKPVSALSSLAIEVAALARIEAGEIEDSQIDETCGLRPARLPQQVAVQRRRARHGAGAPARRQRRRGLLAFA